MIVLSLDTSTLQSCIGFIEYDRETIIRQTALSAPAQPGHAETLVRRIEICLECSGHEIGDLDLLVFGRGPGTFTGLRIGLSTVKGICLAEGIPLIGVSSLKALALGACASGLVGTVIDARRGELFCALYRVETEAGSATAEPLLDERVARADVCLDALAEAACAQPLTLVGNGVFPYRKEVAQRFGTNARVGPAHNHWINPVVLAAEGLERYNVRGGDDLDTVQPVYLREPDAKLPKPPAR